MGCMVSTGILVASDHYFHYYHPNQLSFRPFSSDSQSIKIKNCLYPPTISNEKKYSMYLHRRIGVALLSLQTTVENSTFIELGIGVVNE